MDASPLLGFAGYPSSSSPYHPQLFADLVSRAPLKARFINVLVNPTLLRAFLEFCALPSELALESLLFVLDVERFRHVQPSMARLLANYIYLSYIAPSAPLRINVSGRMRDRIPWPFLPGWEYNPWVFDEILASVGFTLKKHTLLRFERSPVGGLASLFGTPGFSPSEYVRPLRFDHECDPMAAIAEHFEPDIDVVIWVNELEFDASGTQLLTNLSRLSDSFRDRLLERIAAQFIGDRRARCLCDGYFRLATRIVPLQKQRKIKKTRKLCNFFGDNPHEALLRQQLMAVVPPSSQRQAARAAAELVARKKEHTPSLTNGWSSSSDNDDDIDNNGDKGSSSGGGKSHSHRVADRHMRTLDRALSMIGMPNTADSHDSAGSSAGNSPNEPPQRLPMISIFERKKRVDKLREFFGRSADSADSAASAFEAANDSSHADDLHLTRAQRQLLVRRRRKLKAILGEQVDECIIGISPSVSFEEKDEDSHVDIEDISSARNMRIRQYSKIREVLGESAPMPNLAPISPAATDSTDNESSDASSSSSSSSSCSSSYEFVPVESSDPVRPVRAQFWMTSSPESQASVVSGDPQPNKRASLMATLRARKASIIGSIKRATPSTSSLRNGIAVGNMNCATGGVPGAFSLSSRLGRDNVPARSTSILPLSPLPPISPNNFEASFDRGMALRDMVAVAEYITNSSNIPPRVSSARKGPTAAINATAPTSSAIASVVTASKAASTSTNSGSGKTVHWFDSPVVASCPTPSPDKESFHSAADVGMSIILRSPSMKKPSIKSPPPPRQPSVLQPTASSRTTGFPALPINSPPQMSLSHKASVSAVGGRRLERALADKQQDNWKQAPSTPSQPQTCTNIVTIRARRSQSFAISRKIERATVGRKRSNTIGTGKQTGVRTLDDAFLPPTATMHEKKGRRVQSMISPTQLSSMLDNARVSRSRCVTVIPLRYELQRLLAMNGRKCLSGRKSQQKQSNNSSSSNSHSSDGVGIRPRLRRHPYNRRSCLLEYRKKPTVALPVLTSNARMRSGSCPARFTAPRRELPIRPAVARYLSEVRSSCGSYQRISLAQLAPNAQQHHGRRSLDTQAMARRKYSAYTAGMIRRYASVSASSRAAKGCS
ncbi:hypothetical protein GGI23_002327 [Coemansia sp. RSA 2559]|nr:hypothetical protein GGI23_002327 [Coemansia sp. RSA 2559]